MNKIKFIRIFLLILIIIGIGLLATQKSWVPKFVERILNYEDKNTLSSLSSNNKVGTGTNTIHKTSHFDPNDITTLELQFPGYHIIDVDSCIKDGKTFCDQSLIEVNDKKNEKVIIPSLQSLMPEIRESYGLPTLILKEGKNLIFSISGTSAALSRHTIGFYKYNLDSKVINLISYNPGTRFCELYSPDKQYIADYFLPSSSNKKTIEHDETGGEIRVFNIIKGEFVFIKKLDLNQVPYDGVADSEGCPISFSWDETFDKFRYKIFKNLGNKPWDGIQNKLIEDKTITFISEPNSMPMTVYNVRSS